MLNRFKDAVGKSTAKSNRNSGERPPPTPKPEKYCYSRPHFLGLDYEESLASRDFGDRPIMTPRDRSQLPLQAGYAEYVSILLKFFCLSKRYCIHRDTSHGRFFFIFFFRLKQKYMKQHLWGSCMIDLVNHTSTLKVLFRIFLYKPKKNKNKKKKKKQTKNIHDPCPYDCIYSKYSITINPLSYF